MSKKKQRINNVYIDKLNLLCGQVIFCPTNQTWRYKAVNQPSKSEESFSSEILANEALLDAWATAADALEGDNWQKRFASCRNKKRYEKAKLAERSAKIVRIKESVKIRTYWCNICGGYHLTSKSQRKVDES
jgi:hypothetical protein